MTSTSTIQIYLEILIHIMLGEEFANYDFIIESNETIRQTTEVTSVSKGG